MTALLQALAVIGLLLAVATAIGRGVLVWCAGDDRPLAEASVVGAAALVLWLCALAVVVPVGSTAGLAGTSAAAGALLGVGAWRRPARLVPTRAELGPFAVATIAAVAATAPVLLIVAGARSTALVHLGGNHDGFFFTAVPEWLTGHRAVGGPGIRADGTPTGVPMYASVWDHYQATRTRVGGELLTAFTARATGAQVLNTWLPVTLAFQALLALGAQRLAAVLWRPGWWSVLAGAVAATSAHALGAVVDQHTPTLVATAFALVLVAEVHRATRRVDPSWSPLVVALLASGVAATYGELFALLAVPLAALVVVRSVRHRRVEARRWAAAVAWCLPLAAIPWWRAFQGATGTPAPAGYESHVAASRGAYPALRSAALGPAATAGSWATAGAASRLLVATFTAALVIGLALVVARGRARPWWAGLVAAVGGGWWWFGRWEHSGYPQERFVQWAMPVLALGAVAGWATLVGPGHRPDPDPVPDRAAGPGRRPRRALGAGAVAACAVVAGPGLLAGARLDDDPSRRVDASATAPATWVAERDPEGADTVVWAADYPNNLWSPFVLRDADRTAYVSIYEDYYDVRSFGRMSGRRWLLLDRPAQGRASLPPDAVVATNDRFSLVDLDRGPVSVVVPPTQRSRWANGGQVVTVTFDAGAVRCVAADGAELACR